MDAEHFDGLTRSLAASPSRRRALQLLSGFTLVGLFHLEAEAKGHKGKKGGKKKRDKKTTCRAVGAECHGVCDTGSVSQQVSCSSCCTGYCGWKWQISSDLCCVPSGQACPSSCQPGQDCLTCCGTSYCGNDGKCAL